MSWFFYLWIVGILSMVWLPALGNYLDGRAARGEKTPLRWIAERKEIFVSLLSTAVVAVGAILASASTQQQIAEGRRLHHLDYLRQFTAQLDAAQSWLTHASSWSSRLVLYRRDSATAKAEDERDVKDYIAFLNSMPPMPFYKGERAADRRDRIIDALEDVLRADSLEKAFSSSGDDDPRAKAIEAAREAGNWWTGLSTVTEINNLAREELDKLESEVEPRPKPLLER